MSSVRLLVVSSRSAFGRERRRDGTREAEAATTCVECAVVDADVLQSTSNNSISA